MQQRWNNLSYDIYFNSHDIRDLLVEKKSRDAMIRYFERLRPAKIYLECSHPVRAIPLEDIHSIAATFRQHGIAVAGALLPSRYGPLCYNNHQDLASLKTQSIRLAKLFDEIIIDDWLFTVCTCPQCVQSRGKASWAEYRVKTVARKSYECIILPARRANPKVKIIIKFPNWYEGHHHNGYGLREQIAQFDRFCTGIETREPATHHQHIPTYMGYFLQQWQRKIDPEKFASCWFDNAGMKNQQPEYIMQVYQGVLGGGRELVVWSGGTHYRTSKRSIFFWAFRF